MSYAEHDKSVEEGLRAEDRFSDVAKALNHTVKAATYYQNVMQHIDLFVTSPTGTMKSFDVKGVKRISRHGSMNDAIHWLEFQGVSGKDGWLLGKADYIALEVSDCFVLVEREQLLHFAYEKCSYEDISNPVLASYGKKETYVPYRRKDKKDSAMMIEMEDLYNEVSHFLWFKNPAKSMKGKRK